MSHFVGKSKPKNIIFIEPGSGSLVKPGVCYFYNRIIAFRSCQKLTKPK